MLPGFKTIFAHIIVCTTFAFGLPTRSMGQNLLVSDESPAPEGFIHFWSPLADLTQQQANWESVIDLFEPVVVDSLLYPNTQRHRLPLMFAIQYIGGLYWEAISLKKEKFVGTCGREVSPFDSPIREFDINFFPIPHLPEYVDRIMFGKAAMKQKGRGWGHVKVCRPEFGCDSALYFPDRGFMSMECELTPNLKRRVEIDSLFYPAAEGASMKAHPNFGMVATAMGFYGPFVLDCNHDCQPEIHPYDWIWWMDPKEPESIRYETRNFYAGLFRDDSGRFKKWHKKLRHGKMAIPVCFDLNTDTLNITLEPLVTGEMQTFEDKGNGTFPADFTERSFDIRNTVVTLHQPEPLGEGVRYSLRPFHVDSREGLVWGFLEVEIAVEEEFTFRVKMERVR